MAHHLCHRNCCPDFVREDEIAHSFWWDVSCCETKAMSAPRLMLIYGKQCIIPAVDGECSSQAGLDKFMVIACISFQHVVSQ